KLHRDLIRVNDAYRIASIIENRETPVKLESGSFQKNISISTWPSWSQALSSDFGSSLPIDPINEINCQTHTNIDQTTCFDSSIALPDWQFQCEGDSPEKKARYYLYKYLDKDAREMANSMSVLQFNLEYSTSDNWSNVFIGPEWVSHPESLCANMEYVDIIPNP
ncbi:MAG: hypothetical protein QGG82_01145, partial [Patescibacteria group bacterium]|nr:hypothetical protein [Patescibacteria group bacterium]